jgi:hypothetical protein
MDPRMKIVQLTALINGSSAETPKEVAATLQHVFPGFRPRLSTIEVVDGDCFPIQWLAPVPTDAWVLAQQTGYFADTTAVAEQGGHESLFSIEFAAGI